MALLELVLHVVRPKESIGVSWKRSDPYLLFRRDREGDWRQTVFTLLAEHLRGQGVAVRTEDREAFGVRKVGLPGPAVTIRDSLAVLQNDRTGSYWVLDCHDWTRTDDIRPFRWDLRCRGMLKCQYRSSDISGFRTRIVRPWTYFDANWPRQQDAQIQLRNCSRSVAQLYFRGQLWEERKTVVLILQNRKVLNPDATAISHKEFLRELASQRLALSLPGFGDFCHRDVEAFAVGTPVLRPTVRNQFHSELKADFHYVGVNTDIAKDSAAVVAARIEERYREVIGQTDYLAEVARNAAAWYDRNIRFPQSMVLTAKLLGFA